MEETLELADWLKVPSELEFDDLRSAAEILRDEGMTDTPLYRRLMEDPDFEQRANEKRKAWARYLRSVIEADEELGTEELETQMRQFRKGVEGIQ